MFRLKAQHDKRGHDGTRHSEGVLQSKTTEESNNTKSKAESTLLKPLNLKALLDSLPTPPPQGWERVRLDKIISLEYGKALQESKRIEGIYPVMGSNGIVGYHNEYLVKAPAIIVGRKGSAGKVTFIDKNCYPIDTTFYVLNKENNNFKIFRHIE